MVGAVISFLFIVYWPCPSVGLSQIQNLENIVRSGLQSISENEISWIWTRPIAEGGVGYHKYQSILWQGLLAGKRLAPLSQEFLKRIVHTQGSIKQISHLMMTFVMRAKMILFLLLVARFVYVDWESWPLFYVSIFDLVGLMFGVGIFVLLNQLLVRRWNRVLGWSAANGFLTDIPDEKAQKKLEELMPVIEFTGITLMSSMWMIGIILDGFSLLETSM